MKKLLVMLLAVSMILSLAFSFVSCGEDKKEETSSTVDTDKKPSQDGVSEDAPVEESEAPVEESEAPVVSEDAPVESETPDAPSEPAVDSNYAVVPDVMDMTPEEAEQALKDAGFNVKVREKNFDDIPEGKIAEIDLTIGETYERGTKCFLIISSGKTAAAKALEYKQSDLVEARTELSQGENSGYEPINYEFMKAAWLSQYDMEDVYKSGTTQRTEEEFTERVKIVFKGLKDLGFNTLFVQLRPNGDSFYPSAYYCPSKYVVGMYGMDFAYDPLAIMVEEAHALELSIHGWINPLRCMDATSIELINISYGLRQFEQEHMDDYVLKHDGKLYLNPGYAEVRQLIIDGAAEIVRYYDVDGVHIDDYFYPSGMGFEFDRTSFLAQTEYTDPTYFRRASLNQLVSGIYSAVKAENPKVLFGVSPAGKPGAVRGAYADIDTWLSTEGYLDYIMPQLYWGLQHSSGAFDSLYAQWSTLIKLDSIRLIPGMTLSNAAEGTTSEWVNNKDVLMRCIDFANGYGNCSGFSLFSSSSILSHVNGDRVPSTKEEVDNLLNSVSDIADTKLN